MKSPLYGGFVRPFLLRGFMKYHPYLKNTEMCVCGYVCVYKAPRGFTKPYEYVQSP